MARTQQTPGLVIFVAIVLIIVGGFSLLIGLCGAGSLAILAMQPQPGPQAKIQPGDGAAMHHFIAREVPAYYPVMLGLGTIDMLLGLGQLIAAIGLFRLSSTARILAIVMTVIKLFVSFGGHAFNLIWVLPAQGRFFDQNIFRAGGGQPPPFDLNLFLQSIGWITVAVTVFIQIAIVLTVVLVLNSAGVRDAFAGKTADRGREDDEPRRPRYEGYDEDDDYNPPKKPPTAPGDMGITDRS